MDAKIEFPEWQVKTEFCKKLMIIFIDFNQEINVETIMG